MLDLKNHGDAHFALTLSQDLTAQIAQIAADLWPHATPATSNGLIAIRALALKAISLNAVGNEAYDNLLRETASADKEVDSSLQGEVF